ncbi:Cell wall galactomannoprotein [Cordyceps fumosorosea ARSEF 2679]|uniref:Cell wall galactomannoprotein n=1 Tax=Cordyceps fumosorosea (strain ARSEF 2679) TaxID=1081104 RepID=A0A167V835_CORFA|nr:Cell wall galactomannoprotein [Cordyceps fumosorosea ARSEF 2679]OAA62331.1 Cell wall galactomannoprotein [Cordyceps fumosorosea ARSEF 2679]
MKLSICLVAVATAAAAAGIEIRDAASIKAALVTLRADIVALNAAADNFNGGSFQPVVDASRKMIRDINAGIDAAKASTKLSAGDALDLLPTIGSLRAPSRALSHTVAAKVPVMSQAGGCSIVRAEFDGIVAGTMTLVYEIEEKFPRELIIGEPDDWVLLVAPIDEVLSQYCFT